MIVEHFDTARRQVSEEGEVAEWTEYRFRLKGDNGEILVTSEAYTRGEDAERGLDDLLRNVTDYVASN